MNPAQGQTYEDLVCSLEPLPVGLCVNRIVGYTYSEVKNRCVIYESRGCEVRGKYFTNRDECEVKCKPASTLRINPFSYYVESYYWSFEPDISQILYNSKFLPRAVAKNGEIQSEREDYDLEGTLEADVDAVFAKLH
nr:uncharacterized protein LOC108021630 [Drosophila suzukii]